ncbi:sensor histidine kinase [Halopseudomonas salegens]|uniref:sensor histidine kinase n=1 Tax=Halopseudomonas salegens TaxID=1434072 RepID=UPI000A678FD6
MGYLAASFDASFGQLRSALQRERLFTSDVSHELRTPLMIITSSSELLEASTLAARERRQVTRIKRAAEEMRGLVETFLLLARSTSRSERLTGSASLLQRAQWQFEQWQAAFDDKGLDFQLLLEDDDEGEYHPGLLSTIVSNLLRNALHYTNEGEVRLVLTTHGFRVEDSGQGVPGAQQSDIFQPFFRGSEARGEGFGLGLSLVKRICELQGWDVQMYSLTPEGSCFEVRLK